MMNAAVEHLLNYIHGGWPSTKKHTALRSEIEKVRIDALLEAAEIAQDYAKKYADDKRFAALVIHDAILERSREI